MFEQKTNQYQRHADKIGKSQESKANPKQKTKGNQQSPHNQVGKKGGLKGVFDSPANDERAKTVIAVEFIILSGVDNVKTNQPKHHAQSKNDRRKT